MIKKPIIESNVKDSSKTILIFKSEAGERKFWKDAVNDAASILMHLKCRLQNSPT